MAETKGLGLRDIQEIWETEDLEHANKRLEKG